MTYNKETNTEACRRWREKHPEKWKASQDAQNHKLGRSEQRAKKRSEDLAVSLKKEAAYRDKNRTRINATMNRRRHALKLLCLEHLGGMRCRCGFTSTLPCQFDLHHLDRSTKEFEISAAISANMPFEDIMLELDKCIVVCRNCHAALGSKHPDSNTIRAIHGIGLLSDLDVPPIPPKPKPLCSVKDCGKPSRSNGLCPKHYSRWKRTGSTDQIIRNWNSCEEEGCDRPANSRGGKLCSAHYLKKWKRERGTIS